MRSYPSNFIINIGLILKYKKISYLTVFRSSSTFVSARNDLVCTRIGCRIAPKITHFEDNNNELFCTSQRYCGKVHAVDTFLWLKMNGVDEGNTWFIGGLASAVPLIAASKSLVGVEAPVDSTWILIGRLLQPILPLPMRFSRWCL